MANVEPSGLGDSVPSAATSELRKGNPPATQTGSPKPVPRDEVVDAELMDLEPRERALFIHLKREFTHLVRREVGDPYAGLPAPDVLERLDERWPNVQYPERMMRRLELEQAYRQDADRKRLELERYVADTERLVVQGEIDLQVKEGNRAERVLYVMTGVGVLLAVTGYPELAALPLGTTTVAIVLAFLKRNLWRNNK